jgi:hypothetical protein
MLSAGFEPAAFPLGGERSILLSYESLPILDFGFWIADCQVFYQINMSTKRNYFGKAGIAPTFQASKNLALLPVK